MEIIVSGKQMDVGAALTQYTKDSLLSVLDNYLAESVSGKVTFFKERHLFHADISLNVKKGIVLHAHASADDVHVACDLARHGLQNRLQKYKSRLNDHHKKDSSEREILARQYVLHPESMATHHEQEMETHPAIVAESSKEIHTLSVSDAVMRMDLENAPYYVFKNAKTNALNILHWRDDGHIGWIEPDVTL